MQTNFYTNTFTHRNKIYITEWDANTNKKERRILDFNPTLYAPSTTPDAYTIYGEPVQAIDFNSIKEAKDFIKSHKDVPGYDLHGCQSFIQTFMHKRYKGFEPEPSLLNIAYLDIEVEYSDGFPKPELAENEITAITLKSNGVYYIFGTGEYKNDREDVKYYRFNDEEELLEGFIEIWSARDIDIVSGWNVDGFDIPYIINRIRNVLGEDYAKKLSPWGLIIERKKRGDDTAGNWKAKEDEITFEIAGLSVIDYFILYRKFSLKNQESYKLDYIGHVELDMKKIDYSEYRDLNELYEKDHQKFIDYNLVDVEIVERLEEKLKMIELATTLAYSSKVNFKEVFSQIAMWDSIVNEHLEEKGIVVPMKKFLAKPDKYKGAYVKEPQSGLHRWVVSFDLTSLYPMLMIMYNISPETVAEYMDVSVEQLLRSEVPDIPDGRCLTAAGVLFKSDETGILPGILESMFAQRKKAKDSQIKFEKELELDPDNQQIKNKIAKYKNQQKVIKVCLNSCYGALGSNFFRYYSLDQAKAVTFSGQLSIRWMIQELNKYLNNLLKTNNFDYVIASDTDSVYITMDKLVQHVFKVKEGVEETDEFKSKVVDFLDKVCEERFLPLFEKHYSLLAKQQKAVTNRMEMKREAIADRGLWRKKKNYLLRVWNSEGVSYEKPKIKETGLESIRSSTPYLCRKALKDIYPKLLDEDLSGTLSFIEEFRVKFNDAQIAEVSSPRTCNDINKWIGTDKLYKSGTPQHVRAAILYNNILNEKGLDSKYELIRNGDKMRFIALRVPNVLTKDEDVIGYIDTIPEEFNVIDDIDKVTQFQKTFFGPVESLTNTMGWDLEQRGTLF